MAIVKWVSTLLERFGALCKGKIEIEYLIGVLCVR